MYIFVYIHVYSLVYLCINNNNNMMMMMMMMMLIMIHYHMIHSSIVSRDAMDHF